MIKKVGVVAYKLELPESSRIHPVFHVSQLKSCLGPGQQVLSQLPEPNTDFQILVCVLQKRVRQHYLRMVVQVLVQWSGSAKDTATWEDYESLHQQFPLAPAWGQAGFQVGGMSASRISYRKATEEKMQKKLRWASKKLRWASKTLGPPGRRSPPRGLMTITSPSKLVSSFG